MFPCVFLLSIFEGEDFLLIGVNFLSFSHKAEIQNAKQKVLFDAVGQSWDDS